MDRDEAAMLLFVLVAGAFLVGAGAIVPRREASDERTAWRRVWLPALPALITFAFLFGFAVADHERAQAIAPTRLVALVPFGAIWVRALVRAARALRRKSDEAAVTTGFFRPRVVVADALRAALDEGELRAVLAHENAHARHRDPLRMWCVERLTDLQWPLASAHARQRIWLDALELARDDEAIRTPGVRADDLASALVKAARLVRPTTVAGAALTRHDALLARRVRRLLAPTRTHRSRRTLLPWVLGVGVLSFTLGLVEPGAVVAFFAGSG